MRIAIFTDTYLPEVNGVVTSLDAHTRLLAARGHEIYIFCPKYKKWDFHPIPRVHVDRYRAISFYTNRDTRIALPSVATVARRLRKFKPDIVHVHTPLSIGVVGVMAAKALRLPNVQTYHTYIPDFMTYVELHRLLRLDRMQDRVVNSLVFEKMFESGTWRLLFGGRAREIEQDVRDIATSVMNTVSPEEATALSTMVAWQFTRTLYNRADLVLTPSTTLKHELERHGVSVPVEYLSNGIDTSLIAPKESYAPTGRILHAGRLGHEKNVDLVIRAFAQIAERCPQCTLDIVGDGPARPNLDKLAERLGVADRVHMRGFMDRAQLGRIYRDYDVFATASTIETQGIVLLEAMTAGLPIVGVAALAIPELVRDGRCGAIVPAGNEAAFADALEAILGDEALRERYGRACREDVEPHAVESVVDRLESVYAGVLRARERVKVLLADSGDRGD